ncbi:MAG: DUF58 domain-containing protein [Acidimicrobiales bacterium]
MSALPTHRAAMAAVVLAVVSAVLPGGWAASALGAVVLVAALGVELVLAVPPRRLQFKRRLPPSLALGQVGELGWEVHNPTNRSVRVALADEVPPSWRLADRRAVLRVPPRSSVTRRRPIRPARRGRFAVAEIVLRTYGPLGLAARQQAFEVPSQLRVTPAFPSRAATELLLDQRRALGSGVRTTRIRGAGTEFDHLREYQIDDDYRRLDWAATARRGHPVVRTYRAERNQQVAVLLDSGRLMAATVAGATRLEHALDAALALALAAGRLGDRLSFEAHDHRPRVSLPALERADRAPMLIDALIDLEPRLVETDYRVAARHLSDRARRRCLAVVLTDLAEAVTVEAMLPALEVLARRHLVMVATVADPELLAWADGPAEGVSAAYRKAAAARTLEQRRAMAATLARRGMIVLDETPQRLPLALVESYLAIKAEQRL